MTRLNLTSEPRWVELLPGLRLHAAPVTTAIMASGFIELVDANGEAEDLSDLVGRKSRKLGDLMHIADVNLALTQCFELLPERSVDELQVLTLLPGTPSLEFRV